MSWASSETVTSAPNPMPTALVAAKSVPSTVTESPGMAVIGSKVMAAVCAFIIGIARAIKSVKEAIAIILVLFDGFLKFSHLIEAFQQKLFPVEIFKIFFFACVGD